MTGQSDLWPRPVSGTWKTVATLCNPVLMDLSHKLGYIVPAMPDYLITS